MQSFPSKYKILYVRLAFGLCIAGGIGFVVVWLFGGGRTLVQ